MIAYLLPTGYLLLGGYALSSGAGYVAAAVLTVFALSTIALRRSRHRVAAPRSGAVT